MKLPKGLTLVQIGTKFYTLALCFDSKGDIKKVDKLLNNNKVLLTYNPREGEEISMR